MKIEEGRKRRGGTAGFGIQGQSLKTNKQSCSCNGNDASCGQGWNYYVVFLQKCILLLRAVGWIRGFTFAATSEGW